MAEQQWYYRKGKGRFGPVDSAELKRLAESGEIGPEDLLRGVGMSEWVPAGKVKGLFAPKPTPKPVQTVPPKVQPAVPQKAPPKPPPQMTPIADNPFAQFGLDSTPPDDPFAKAEAVQNDPFVGAMPGYGLGGGIAFDQLAALEKQGQTIYREPPPEADPLADKKENAEPEAVGMGTGAKIGLLIVPYVFMILMTLFLASVYAISHHFVFGILPMILAILFSFVMTSGLTKAIGLFAGNCLEKLKIKNEVLALGYGGLLGLFGIYVLMGGYAWAALFFNPFQGVYDKVKAEIQAQEEAEAAAAAERKAAGIEEEEKGEKDGEEQIVFDPFGGDGDALDALDEFNRKKKEKERRDSYRDAGFYGIHDKPIPLFEAYSPIWVYRVFMLLWWYWPIHGIILLLGTAHATWMSNLGHDPTK